MIFRGEYAFLSNFHPCEIVYEGILYPSSEHAYQAAKSSNHEEKLLISKLKSPGKAKRHKTQFPQKDFHVNKVQIMYEILKIKFSDAFLSSLLEKTIDSAIIEDNTWGDRFWGVCDNSGENVLGNLLMVVRYENRIK